MIYTFTNIRIDKLTYDFEMSFKKRIRADIFDIYLYIVFNVIFTILMTIGIQMSFTKNHIRFLTITRQFFFGDLMIKVYRGKKILEKCQSSS